MKLKDRCVQEKSMRWKDMGVPSISHELGKIFLYIRKSIETSFQHLGINCVACLTQ